MSSPETTDPSLNLPANSRSRRRWLIGWLLAGILAVGGGWLGVFGFQQWVETVNSRPPHRIPRNAPYIPTPQDVVDRMLELANVDENDVVFDLGCGDGRIVITAAKRYGCRAVGFEYDAKIAELARENVRQQGVADLVTIEQRDIFTIEPAELNRASVITLYLLPWMNQKLKPNLARLDPGKVIVAHDWDLPGCKPDHSERMNSVDDDAAYEHGIFMWTTPLKETSTRKD